MANKSAPTCDHVECPEGAVPASHIAGWGPFGHFDLFGGKSISGHLHQVAVCEKHAVPKDGVRYRRLGETDWLEVPQVK
jgi:hypothetical protein